jgi:hypothetical protein
MNHVNRVLTNLCSYVNCNCTADLFQNKEWFTTQTWSISEEKEFQKWLFNYIQPDEVFQQLKITFKEAAAESRKEFVQKFTLYYGWDLTEMQLCQEH